MLGQLLFELIKFKTLSNDHKENDRALIWVKNQLKGLPVQVKEFKFNGFPSLMITTQKTRRPRLLLAAHIDVVGGSRKVFVPKKIDGRLYGRGAFDMKYAIACYIKLLKKIGKDLPKYDFGILITTDEELGGKFGMGEFVKKGFGCKVCILPDSNTDFKLQKSAKGVYQIMFESRGKSAHGSRPWLGRNAVTKLINFLVELDSLFVKEPCGDNNHYHNTINLGQIYGGEETNKIPDRAFAKVDIRFIPETSIAKLRKSINNLLSEFPEIRLKEMTFSNAYKIDIKNKYVQDFARLMKEKLKIIPEYINSQGSNDARYLVEKGIPAIVLRPNGGGHHTEKEFIDLKSLDDFYIVLEEYVLSVAKIKQVKGR